MNQQMNQNQPKNVHSNQNQNPYKQYMNNYGNNINNNKNIPQQQQPQQYHKQYIQQKPVQQQAPAKPKKKTVKLQEHKFEIYQKYDVNKVVGAGAYGVVCSGTDTEKNTKIAVKKVTNAFEDLIDAKRILREIKMLKFFDHENIIQIEDMILPDNKTGYEDIYIITELMETDLHRVIYSRQDLTDDHVQYFLYQLLRGLKFMHSSNVIHRDLKPSNLLVNKNCDLKICDLGLARGFDQEEELKTEYVVTRWYRAPEVILSASEYTKAVDIWSVGCIFAELLGRTPLFPGKDYLEQIQRIIAILGTPKQDEQSFITSDGALKYIRSLPKRTKQTWASLYPESNSQGLDLLDKMLTFNPNHRYSVEECLAHPYFEELHNIDEEPGSDAKFDFSWDNFELTKESIQTKIYNEALEFQKPAGKQQQQNEKIQQVLQPQNQNTNHNSNNQANNQQQLQKTVQQNINNSYQGQPYKNYSYHQNSQY